MYNRLNFVIIDCYSRVPVLDIEIYQYRNKTSVTGYYITPKFKKVLIDVTSSQEVCETLSTIGIFNKYFKGVNNFYEGINQYAQSLGLSYLIYSKSLILDVELKRVF